MRVIVTEYQPAWVEQFEEEAQALKQILKENCLKLNISVAHLCLI